MEQAEATARHLAEQLGLAFEAFGMPRMVGRVLGWILLADAAEVSLEELAEKLGVSKASVSHATRLLQQMGMLQRVGRPGTRQAFYRLTEDPWAALLAMEERISRGFASFAREARSQLPPSPEREARLEEMESALGLYLEMLSAFAREWKQRKGTP